METDSFSDYPQSVNELRAERSGNAADWSPREALLQMLRDIDAGTVVPDALIISFRVKVGRGYSTSFSAACPDSGVMLALLEQTKFRVWRDSL
jgi:hypothetical protein